MSWLDKLRGKKAATSAGPEWHLVLVEKHTGEQAELSGDLRELDDASFPRLVKQAKVAVKKLNAVNPMRVRKRR
jgi:hypothetical protein